MDEVCLIMEEKKLDVLCVNETKRKGKGVSEHGPFKALWSGVAENDHASMGVGLLLSERMIECMTEYECVSPRLLWVRLKVGLLRIRVIGVYAPDISKSATEKEEFWKSVEDILNECKDNERIVMLGDFNGWVGVRREGCEGVLGIYGDKRVNDNGRSLIEVCLEKNLVITNTMFDHKEIHMYTWQRGEKKSMIDFVIVDERLKGRVVDTRVFRGSNIGTDHFLVVSRVSGLFKSWRHRPTVSTTELTRVKVENLDEVEVQKTYLCKLKERLGNVAEVKDGKLEEVWEKFKKGVTETAEEVCGVSKRKNAPPINWWDSEVRQIVNEKKKVWQDLLAIKASKRVNASVTEDDVDSVAREYKRIKKVVKEKVDEKKRKMKEKCDFKLCDNFRDNIKLFWKQVKTSRSGSHKSKMNVIRDEKGELVTDEKGVLQEWMKYFESLFEADGSMLEASDKRVEDEEETEVDERDIYMDEIISAMKSMKKGKAAGYDRITVEMLRGGKELVASWLCLIFNKCWNSGKVPEDWRKAVVVPLYKGKGSRQDAKNYRGISLLSIVSKLYAKVLIERVMQKTDQSIWDVQAGFRKGMGCTDQVFSLRCLTEKHLAKHKKVYCAFVDLEKAYDRVDRKELWKVLSEYGLESRLIQALKSLYEDSRACVRIDGVYTDWFGISRGVRQGCVASPWLFNLFLDSCMKGLKERDCGVVMNGTQIKCLLYADDQVILASSAQELQEMMSVMNDDFVRKGMKVNVTKTKVMVFERDEEMTDCTVMLGGEKVEQVREFVYLGSLFTRDGKSEEDIERRVKKGNSVSGAIHSVMSSQTVSAKARMAIHNGVLVPTLMYGSESWVWQKKNESRINAVEMRSLRKICGVKLSDRVSNEVIRKRCGLKDDIVTRIEKGMLRWFGHLERMNERRITKEIYCANVEGTNARGRPRKTYADQIEVIIKKAGVRSDKNRRACMNRLMDMNEAKEVCKDRSRWRSIVSAYPHGKQA